jgi:hypothetical protein
MAASVSQDEQYQAAAREFGPALQRLAAAAQVHVADDEGAEDHDRDDGGPALRTFRSAIPAIEP